VIITIYGHSYLYGLGGLIPGEHLVPEDSQTLLKSQLKPVPQGDTVPCPIVEILWEGGRKEREGERKEKEGERERGTCGGIATYTRATHRVR